MADYIGMPKKHEEALAVKKIAVKLLVSMVGAEAISMDLTRTPSQEATRTDVNLTGVLLINHLADVALRGAEAILSLGKR